MRFRLLVYFHEKKIISQFRSLHTTCTLEKIVPNKSGKSKSSQEWLTRQLNDEYVKKSRYDSYRCRSAYKLLEIDERFKIFRPGFTVVDCGAAPGSWTQVVAQKLNLDTDSNVQDKNHPNGLVIAVDLKHMYPIKGAIILKESDFMDPKVQDQIYSLLPDGKADVVMSDMAPNASGSSILDSASIMSLVYGTLKFSMKTLQNEGTFLCKVWDNCEVEKMVKTLNILFSSVKRVKPKASRLDSAELYLLARGYKGKQVVSS